MGINLFCHFFPILDFHKTILSKSDDMIKLLPLPFTARKCNHFFYIYKNFLLFLRGYTLTFLPDKFSLSLGFRALVLCFERSHGKEHFIKHSGNPEEERGQYFLFCET